MSIKLWKKAVKISLCTENLSMYNQGIYCLSSILYIILCLSTGFRSKQLCLLYLPFLPFTKTVTEKPDVRPHQDRIFDKLLHAIHQTISVSTRHESLISRLPFIGELCICLGDRRLIRDRKHTHPPTKDTQRVDRIEWLGSTAHLGNSQRSALGGTDTSGRQRNPIDLIFEHGGLTLRKIV